MGCTQSKIEGEESVSRCRERKHLMKSAVSARNAFSAAHSAYAVSLKSTGAALSDFGQGEVVLYPTSQHHHTSSSSSIPQQSSSSSIPSSSANPSQAPTDSALPPPPPPLPDFPAAPLQRAASMPEIPLPKKKSLPIATDSTIEEGDADDEHDEDDDDSDALDNHRNNNNNKIPNRTPQTNMNIRQPARAPPTMTSQPSGTPEWLGKFIFDTDNIPSPSLSQMEPPPPPPITPEPPPVEEKVVTEPPVAPPPAEEEPPPPVKPAVKKQRASAASGTSGVAGEGRRGKMVAAPPGPKLNLLQVLDKLDDHFLKAYESAYDVSKMLEATRMHYHSNFADNRGHIDHSARVMRVITWNRSVKGLPKEDDGNDDDFDNDEAETHATILDKMLAWEKKLYDEVKAGELMKIDYQRKCALLNKQTKRGASPQTLEKTKAVVSHMHTRLIVDMQSMDSTVTEINRLLEEQLYPRLVDLVEGMATMWETMYIQHISQYKIVADLRNLDMSLAPKETTEQHHKRTEQLWSILREWHSHFQKLMKHQKEYIQALSSWLKLSLVPIESSLKEKAASSPPKLFRPKIQPLLLAWHDQLEKLPDELARAAISAFSEVVNTIMIIQEDELKMKEKCEETRRDYMRKSRAFEDWHRKYIEKKAAREAADQAAAAAAAAGDQESSDAAHNEDLVQERRSVVDGLRADAANNEDLVLERRSVVDGLRARLAQEEDSYQRLCRQVREKSVGSLRTHLPSLFRAMSEFSMASSDMYSKLVSITKPEETTDHIV